MYVKSRPYVLYGLIYNPFPKNIPFRCVLRTFSPSAQTACHILTKLAPNVYFEPKKSTRNYLEIFKIKPYFGHKKTVLYKFYK